MGLSVSSGDAAVDRALEAIRDELWRSVPYRFVGRPIAISFIATGVKQETAHRCSDVPDGFAIVRANGAVVTEEPGVTWTKDLAFLRSTVATTVVGFFYKLREDPINVST